MAALRTRLAVALGACALIALLLLVLSPHAHRASANPLGGMASVSAGLGHTCALTTAGGVKCWGYGYGNVPADVPALTSGVAAIATGFDHTCALTTGGGVKCWGSNASGQLGDGTTTDSAAPVDVVGLTSGVAAISVGDYHTCAVTTAGGVRCWGSNTSGQLGDGTTTDSAAPVGVIGLTSGVAAVSAGSEVTCAVTASGGARCWGLDYGTVPAVVPTLTSGVAAISVGGVHICALTATGGVKCWGQNAGGQVGDGTLTPRAVPVDVSGLASGVVAVSAGGLHTCAVTATGGVKCWGSNLFGQLGDGTLALRTNPIDVSGLTSGAALVSAGDASTCAVTTAAGIKCWGFNGDGRLGDGTQMLRLVPVDVVAAGPKPTVTSTACPLAGCPTATATPTPPPSTGIDFSIGIDTDANGSDDCTTHGGPTKCSMSAGQAFTVNVRLHSLPPGVSAYVGVDAYLNYSGLASKDNATAVAWPACAYSADQFLPGIVHWGCAAGINVSSTYVGVVGTAGFNCTAAGTISLLHGPNATDIVQFVPPFDYQSFFEPEGSTETLTINCPAPTPTLSPTPTRTPHPPPLGGVAGYPHVSSGPSATLLALIATATAFAALAITAATRRLTARRRTSSS